MSKTLMVYLAADTSRFRRELGQADDHMGRFGKSAGALGGAATIAGAAIAAAGVAAAAFAVKLGVDAVQAAMAEEAELAKLTKTLDNLGFGAASGQVNQFIDSLQFSANVADSELRPALDRLVRSTGDVSEAQSALELALDISAGTGKSLKSVSDALGKAYDGNTGSLGKLGTGLDKATLKTGDMEVITRKLAGTFEGQAATAAETLTGQLQGVQIAADEAKEAFGKGLVDGLASAVGGLDDLEQIIRDLTPEIEAFGGFVARTLVASFYKAQSAIAEFNMGLSWLSKGWSWLMWQVGRLTEAQYQQAVASADATWATNEQAKAQADAAVQMALHSDEVDKAARENDVYSLSGTRLNSVNREVTESTEDLSDQTTTLTGNVGRATTALDAHRQATGSLASALQQAATDVKSWTDQIIAYRTSLTETISSGIDLQAAFTQQGTEGGVSLVEAFRQQLADAKNFAGLLSQLKASGASQAMIDEIAGMGPDIGSKLATQLLDEGIVKTIADEWEQARKAIFDVTSTLVPDFLKQGQDNALALLEGLQTKTRESEQELRAIGKEMGKPIGAEIKAAVAAAMEEALAAARAAAAAVTLPPGVAAPGAAPVAAGAGVVVPITDPTTMTDYGMASLLNNVLTNANTRGGIITDQSVVFG